MHFISDADFVVWSASASAFFILFLLTSGINYYYHLQGSKPFAHGVSMLATKITNILLLSLLLVLHFSDTLKDVHFSHYLYLWICINVAAKVNWNLFALTDTSMHARVLTVIYEYGPISDHQLLELYNRAKILQARLPRLISLGQVHEKNGVLFLGGNFVIYGGMILAFLRLLLGIPIRPKTIDLKSEKPVQFDY